MSDFTIDLGSERAARREGKTTELLIRLGDDVDPLSLPPELPVDALSPLKAVELHSDLGLLFRMEKAADGQEILRDLVTVRPALAGELLDAGKGVLERLFCSVIPLEFADDVRTGGCDVTHTRDGKPDPLHDRDCQYLRFLSWRPSTQDYLALFKGLWQQYGASLGEALAPSGSSGTGGATSSTTSKRTSSSTPARSSRTPATTRSS